MLHSNQKGHLRISIAKAKIHEIQCVEWWEKLCIGKNSAGGGQETAKKF